MNNSKTDIQVVGTQGNFVLLMHVGVHKPQKYDFYLFVFSRCFFCVALAILKFTLYVDQAGLTDLLGSKVRATTT